MAGRRHLAHRAAGNAGVLAHARSAGHLIRLTVTRTAPAAPVFSWIRFALFLGLAFAAVSLNPAAILSRSAAGRSSVGTCAFGLWPASVNAEQLHEPVVSIVRSDDAGLASPASADSALTYPQVEEMVRRAVSLSGGLGPSVHSDSAWIVIKPNIVFAHLRTAITDWQVVKAVVKLAHEAAPKGRITVAEGSPGFALLGHPEVDSLGLDHVDGFAENGFRQLLEDPDLRGIALDIVDLNFDELREVPVPGGGNARERYYMPRTILDCDFLISVPKLKRHQEAGVTAGMKNMVGILPGLKYGWPKMSGFPPGSGIPGVAHSSPVIDETIVDLNLIAGIDFCVVDALLTQDRNESEGDPLRMNLILAGSDVVAVDAVGARIVGLNPDDVEYLTLADMLGMGISDLDMIHVAGDSIPLEGRRFKPSDRWTARYGQGNRNWLLKGPSHTAGINDRDKREFVDPAKPNAAPGKSGWSTPVYFGHDKIDLVAFFGDHTDCVVYAYTDFVAPRSQPAELWVGSDESMTVWINGREAYAFQGSRRHNLPNEKVPVIISGGRNRLLVKISQTSGEFGFSLNICQVERDMESPGNRVFGLKFLLPGVDRSTRPLRVRADDFEDYASGEAEVVSGIAGIDPLMAGRNAPGKMLLKLPLAPKEGPQALSSLQAILASKGDTLSQDYLAGLSGMAFGFNYCRNDPRKGVRFVSDDLLPSLCQRLGYSYAYSFNEETRKAWARLKGWISLGYPVIVWRWVNTELAVGYDDTTQTVYLKRNWDPKDSSYPWPSFTREWRRPPFFGQEMRTTAQLVVGDKIAQGGAREGMLASLVQAIGMANTPFVPVNQDTFATGFASYELWLKELSEEVVYENLSEKERWSIINFNGYLLPRLARSRASAAAYLREISAAMDQSKREYLLQAAERYQEVADRLGEVVKMLPQGDRDKGVIPEQERAKFAQREAASQAVRLAYEREREAIGLLQKVLQ